MSIGWVWAIISAPGGMVGQGSKSKAVGMAWSRGELENGEGSIGPPIYLDRCPISSHVPPKGLLGGSQRRANQVFLDSPIHRWLASFFGPILQPHPQTPWQTKN
jgi:hypothetical protein